MLTTTADNLYRSTGSFCLDYLFGRELTLSKANIASGLASAAVTVMGGGFEQIPLAVIEDIPFVDFVDHDQ